MTATPITVNHGEIELMFSAMAHDIIDEITAKESKKYVSYHEAGGTGFPKIIGPKLINAPICDISGYADEYITNNLELICPEIYRLIKMYLKKKTYIYSKTIPIKKIFALNDIAYYTEKEVASFNISSDGIMISSIGTGLSFVGVNEVHIIDDITVPEYQQIVGRAVRKYSHAHTKDKTVTVYIWNTKWKQRVEEYEPIAEKLEILKHNTI